jgi:hypothetical protein
VAGVLSTIRTTAKKIPLLRQIARLRRYWREGGLTNPEILVKLAPYAPASPGSREVRARLTIQSAASTFSLIEQLLRETETTPLELKPIELLCQDDGVRRAADELATLFSKYGSDKSDFHNYHLLYASILWRRRLDALRVLEIGIGSINPAVVSYMRHGHPGASLRAFRDFLPNAEIIGADIDRTTLFEEERIQTHFVDQTDTSSLAALARLLAGRPFDLVIDDGLHSPSANIATLTIALKLLKPDGHVVIEDIPESSLPIWHTISALLAPEYQPVVLSAKRGHLFVVQKRG